MSVSLIVNDAQRQTFLSDAVGFNNLRGSSLTLDSLVVNTIRANTITMGDDVLPDVYYFGQCPYSKLVGCGIGSTSTTTSVNIQAITQNTITPPYTVAGAGIETDYVGLTGGTTVNATTTLTLAGGAGVASAADGLILFPDPIHFTRGSSGDPLNPYVGASIISAGSQLPTAAAPSTGGAAYVRMGLQCLNPAVVVQTTTTSTANGFYLVLPLVATNQANTYGIPYMFGGTTNPVQHMVTWFVAGTEPSTPPSTFQGGTASVAAPVTITPYAPFPPPATPIQGYSFTISFSGGAVGSSAQFPLASPNFTTWADTSVTPVGSTGVPLNFKLPNTTSAYPPVVFPITNGTADVSMKAIATNPYIVGGALQPPPVGSDYLYTGGIFIQQLWWVSTYAGALPLPAHVAPAGIYNVTHLFTCAGNAMNAISGTAPGAQYPLNPAKVYLGARGAPTAEQAANDGPFQVKIELPRQVTTWPQPSAPPLATEAGAPYNQSAYSTQQPRLGQSAILAPNPGVDLPYDYFIATSTFGYWVVLLATTSINAGSATAARCSDGSVIGTGKGTTIIGNVDPNFRTARIVASAGQFSKYPSQWGVGNLVTGGFTNQDIAPPPIPTLNPPFTTSVSATGGRFQWTSTPVNPVQSIYGSGEWYTDVLNPAGTLILTPGV